MRHICPYPSPSHTRRHLTEISLIYTLYLLTHILYANFTGWCSFPIYTLYLLTHISIYQPHKVMFSPYIHTLFANTPHRAVFSPYIHTLFATTPHRAVFSPLTPRWSTGASFTLLSKPLTPKTISHGDSSPERMI